MTFGTKKDEILHFVHDYNARNVDIVGRYLQLIMDIFVHDYNAGNVDGVILKAGPEESHLYKSFFIVNTASCVLSLRSSLISTLVIWFFTVP